MFGWLTTIRQATEWKLVSVGLVCAASSTWFAIHMISNSDQAPALTGSEHFMLFARPSTSTKRDPYMRFVPADDAAATAAIESDPMPLGSIIPRGQARSEVPKSARSPAKALEGFVIRGAYDGKVLVQGPTGFELVGLGDRLTDAGAVLSIRFDNGQWVVLTDKGSIGAGAAN